MKSGRIFTQMTTKFQTITSEDYDALFAKQGYVCAICSAPYSNSTKKFPVDHDHNSGQARGIICWRCNTALDAIGNTKESVHKFLDYLEGGYLSWDNYFIEHARVVSKKSKDPSTKVGAILVKNRRIISSGYNGLPAALEDTAERYEKPLKYEYILHAEENAIIQCTQPDTGSSQGTTMYLYPLPPCHECAKTIIQAGVERVVYYAPKGVPDRWASGIKLSFSMLQEANITVINIEKP